MPPRSDETPNKDAGLTILFGKPGAGKSTIANEVLEKFPSVTQLDLDVCIPDWMRENFSKGIYPTLAQRQEFSKHACHYVKDQIKIQEDRHVLITFSFVNQDLRDEFRQQFPTCTWILLDVSNALAQERIETRQGHFYKVQKKQKEWEFDPVHFPHFVLDGTQSFPHNAQIIIQHITKNNEMHP